MQDSEIKALIEQGIAGVEATVRGDGSHYEAIVIGDCFEGKSMLQQQKMVYATINQYITSGEIHAMSIKTYTPAQWEKARRFNIGSE
jgi:acid stress-induced BolA-like protein IbaG/YrbA